MLRCRCIGMAAGGMAAPIIEPLSKKPLDYCKDDWHVGWHTQVSNSLQTCHQQAL